MYSAFFAFAPTAGARCRGGGAVEAVEVET